jgi:hypothetical protein
MVRCGALMSAEPPRRCQCSEESGKRRGDANDRRPTRGDPDRGDPMLCLLTGGEHGAEPPARYRHAASLHYTHSPLCLLLLLFHPFGLDLLEPVVSFVIEAKSSVTPERCGQDPQQNRVYFADCSVRAGHGGGRKESFDTQVRSFFGGGSDHPPTPNSLDTPCWEPGLRRMSSLQQGLSIAMPSSSTDGPNNPPKLALPWPGRPPPRSVGSPVHTFQADSDAIGPISIHEGC